MSTAQETNEVINMTEIRTLSEFIEWASQFKDKQYLFRGVPNDTFNIQASTYLRLPEADRNNPSELLKINKELIDEARTLGHDMRNGRRLSDLELLAELQHFGAATCLIDFSQSALNALWFACQPNPKKEKNGEVKEKNGRVFAFARNKVAHLKTVTPHQLRTKDIAYFFSDKYLYEWTPKLQNNRIIAQHSVFLFGRDQIEADAECVIIKCHKQEILNSLKEVSDIREATMYPDFDGFARQKAHNQPYVKPHVQDLLDSGVEAHKRENFSDAIDFCDRAIKLKPDSAEAYFNRGMAYKSKGDADNDIADYDRAIADFTQAIKHNPDFVGAYNHRGVAYLDKGDYDLAIADFTQAINLKEDSEFYYNRGLAHYKKSDQALPTVDFNKAIADFTKAIDNKPYFVDEVYYNRGRAWLHQKDWEKAKSDLQMADREGMDIITAFHTDYGSVSDLEQKYCVKLPPDIIAMLTPP